MRRASKRRANNPIQPLGTANPIIASRELLSELWESFRGRTDSTDLQGLEQSVINEVDERDIAIRMAQIAQFAVQEYPFVGDLPGRAASIQNAEMSNHVIDFVSKLSFEDAVFFILEMRKHPDMQHLARDVWEWFKARIEYIQSRSSASNAGSLSESLKALSHHFAQSIDTGPV